jgi:hypothetical protein
MMMKKQIRINTFETNSSSVHTLQISKDLMDMNELVIKKDGYVHINLDQYYGRDLVEYKTQEEKLKYICTWMYVYYGNDIKQMYDGYEWKEFETKFCDYVNNHSNSKQRIYHCNGIKINKIKSKYDYGSAGDFLDHQSCPYGLWNTEGFIFNFYDTDMLVNFIFNPYLWLQTDCD